MAHDFVPRRHRALAKRLRVPMTDAETKLWRAIRARRFGDIGFRRQVPIGPYVVDFVSHGTRLVVEVDGGHHDLDAERRHDMARTAWLATRGYRVLRFWNTDVLKNLDGVLATIEGATKDTATLHEETS